MMIVLNETMGSIVDIRDMSIECEADTHPVQQTIITILVLLGIAWRIPPGLKRDARR